MAQRFLTPIDLSTNELLNARLQFISGSNPSSGLFEGWVIYNSTEKQAYYYDGTAWRSMAGDITEVIAGNGLTGGGSAGHVTLNVGAGTGINVAADSISVNILGLQNLVAPAGDRIYFYDQSEGTSSFLSLGSGLSISGTTIINSDAGSSQSIYKNFSDGSNSSSASNNNDTFRFRGSNGVTVLVGNNDVTFGDNLLISLSNVPNSALQNSAVTINAGSGLTGGGSVSLGSSVTLNIGAGSGISVEDDSISVDSTVVRTSGDQTIAGNKTFSNNVVINGDLTVNGTVTTVNTEEINLADNIILLNSNFVSGTPTENSGIEIRRGSSSNVQFIWDEANDRWSTVNQPFHIGSIGTVSSTSFVLVESSGLVQKITPANLVGVGLTLNGTAPISVTGSAGTYTISVGTASDSSVGVVELATNSETIAGSDTSRATTPAGVSAAINSAVDALGVAVSIGDSVATSFVITHGMNTRDIIVQVYDNTTYETVYTDVLRNSVNQVTVTFASAPATNAYRVVIQRIV